MNIENVIDGLKSGSNKTSAILTVLDANPAFNEYADLVSEKREIKYLLKAGMKV